MNSPRPDSTDTPTTAPSRSALTIDYFLHANLDEAGMVLQAAQAVVRHRESSTQSTPPEPGSSTDDDDDPAPPAGGGGPAPAAGHAPETAPAPPPQVESEPNGKPDTAGTTAQGNKLTAAQVRNIRRRYRPGEGAALADKHGVTEKTIQRIARRETWSHLPPAGDEYHPTRRPGQPYKKLTATKVREIRRGYRSREDAAPLAKKHGVTKQTILDVIRRTTWKALAPEPGEYDPETENAVPAPRTASGPESPSSTAGPDANGTNPPATSDREPKATPPLRRKALADRAAGATPRADTPARAAQNRQNRQTATPPRTRQVAAEIRRLGPESISSIRERIADEVPIRRIARDFGISEDAVTSLAN